MADRLHGVGVEKNALFPAEGRQLRHRLEGADFIVGEHDGHESRVVPQGRAQVLHPDNAVFMYRQKRHFKALFFQGIEGVKDGVVFKRRGNQVPFPFFGHHAGGHFDRPVVRLAAAGGHVHLVLPAV